MFAENIAKTRHLYYCKIRMRDIKRQFYACIKDSIRVPFNTAMYLPASMS